jgi:hypothetical protein
MPRQLSSAQLSCFSRVAALVHVCFCIVAEQSLAQHSSTAWTRGDTVPGYRIRVLIGSPCLVYTYLPAYLVVEAGQAKKGRRVDTRPPPRPKRADQSISTSALNRAVRTPTRTQLQKEFSVLHRPIPYRTVPGPLHRVIACRATLHICFPSIHPSSPIQSTQPRACVIADLPTHHPPSRLRFDLT